ncbi:uncharacterized protein LOC121377142 isoform X2 [Gigantopelta aegis]|uniref:uncharacterized protein LOC121377142 isoform X2 n=1 Tax=Gigantopelta aegis TaxID=1735272 RepID=UPI001B8880F5|nr:uncharacterized protein LOC121377142 isoform X2 [Gigantopelta aegis]
MFSTSNDPEELIECPYDTSHMIRAKRMPYHLMKCRQNSTKELAVCPFNARHEVPKPELRHHMANCPDKAVLEKDLAYQVANEEGTFFKGCTDVPGYNAYNVEINENWEEDINPRPRIGVHPSFRERIQYRDVTGYSTSQKKAFHGNLAPDPEQPSQEQAADDINNAAGKLRLPKKASEAYKLSVEATPEEKPAALPPNIFMYSLSLAGIGRGRGGNPPSVGSVQPQPVVIQPSSPYAVMTQMGQLGRGRHAPTTAAVLTTASHQQKNNNNHLTMQESFGDDLDEFLDEELATRSDVTPKLTMNGQLVPQSVTTFSSSPTSRATTQAESAEMPQFDDLEAPPTRTRSIGRGLMGVPSHMTLPTVGVQNGGGREGLQQHQQQQQQLLSNNHDDGMMRFNDHNDSNGVTGTDQRQTNHYGIQNGVRQHLPQTNGYTDSGDDRDVGATPASSIAAVPPPPGFVLGGGRGLRPAMGRGIFRGVNKSGDFVLPVMKTTSHVDRSSNISVDISNNNSFSVLSERLIAFY